MADEADISAEFEEGARRASLEAMLKRNQTVGTSLSECLECGEPIPEARRLAVAGCKYCIDCARKAEQVTGRMFPNA